MLVRWRGDGGLHKNKVMTLLYGAAQITAIEATLPEGLRLSIGGRGLMPAPASAGPVITDMRKATLRRQRRRARPVCDSDGAVNTALEGFRQLQVQQRCRRAKPREWQGLSP
jgi:hypothetical protein